ncbi:hypothetical protein QBC40DRAFT_286578 [Triangularia verruculosa]|uniref:Uncharacterized protein n=1 Tax=Triangularia verruculosa TaxID=2587418 RepID=A0AAN7ATF1_9PEZI|nr:hypothetical protein QBC40DRAFT_286578 [Triangularia verruculosa]
MASNPIPIQPALGRHEHRLHVTSPKSSISPNSVYQPIECPPPRSKKYRPHPRPRRLRRHNSDYEPGSESESESEKLELEAEEHQLPDSGYGTQSSVQSSASNSPNSLLSLHLNKQKPSLVQQDVRSSPLPGTEDLYIFRGAGVDPSVQVVGRFREIMPELQRVLQKHVTSQKWSSLLPGKRKKKRDEVIMTMRLMMVGKTKSTARPAIVIFVSGHETKGLETLMQQKGLKELYYPNDGIVTNFDVVIVGDPARKKFLQVDVSWDGGSSFMMNDKGTATWCGARIRMDAEGRSAVSTFGGLVKLTKRDGEVQMVGMTAAHVLEGLLEDEDEESEGEDEEAEEEAEEEDYRIHFHPRKPFLGQLMHPELPVDDSELDTPARDWSLFEIDHNVKVKPNVLQRPTFPGSSQARPSGPRQEGDELTLAPAQSFPEIAPIEVALISQSNPRNSAKLGFLSHLPGGLMMSHEKGFVDAYILTLDDSFRIENGDSGAWVINPISKTVYGHLVSSDFTGDGYIIPLHATFSEITQTLPDIRSVCLPTTAELVSYALRSSTLYFEPTFFKVAGSSSITESPAWTRSSADMLRPKDGQERRMSELFTLAHGRRKNDEVEDGGKRKTVLSDRDSGYGSCGSSIMCHHGVANDSEAEDEMASCSVW